VGTVRRPDSPSDREGRIRRWPRYVLAHIISSYIAFAIWGALGGLPEEGAVYAVALSPVYVPFSLVLLSLVYLGVAMGILWDGSPWLLGILGMWASYAVPFVILCFLLRRRRARPPILG